QDAVHSGTGQPGHPAQRRPRHLLVRGERLDDGPDVRPPDVPQRSRPAHAWGSTSLIRTRPPVSSDWWTAAMASVTWTPSSMPGSVSSIPETLRANDWTIHGAGPCSRPALAEPRVRGWSTREVIVCNIWEVLSTRIDPSAPNT